MSFHSVVEPVETTVFQVPSTSAAELPRSATLAAALVEGLASLRERIGESIEPVNSFV
jgi:hypothetical protein